ncbi:hypothetical protein R3P38DRAFT_3040824 [Favolaschia claudopus]|uniref:CFEM domain-containing protein n=1 Tax=Favolaschia claudopus TaxID=2862362 RepID=A0AAW0AAH6_9AGAR
MTTMKFSLLMTAVTGLFLASIPSSIAQDDGGLAPEQQCLLNCSLAAVDASGCDIQDTPCVCASSVYATNVTQCAETTCGFPVDVVQGFLQSGCEGVSSAGSSGSSSGSSVAGSGSGSQSASKTNSFSVSSTFPDPRSSSGSQSPSNSAQASSQSQSTVPNAPNSAVAIGGRTKAAAAFAMGLVVCALLA